MFACVSCVLRACVCCAFFNAFIISTSVFCWLPVTRSRRTRHFAFHSTSFVLRRSWGSSVGLIGIHLPSLDECVCVRIFYNFSISLRRAHCIHISHLSFPLALALSLFPSLFALRSSMLPFMLSCALCALFLSFV